MKNEVQLKFKKLFEDRIKKFSYTNKKVQPEFFLSKDDIYDDADLTAVETAQNMELRLKNRESLYLKKIFYSLNKIKDGTFGQCEGCEEDIPKKRLEARPTTTLCISCKEEQEHAEKGFFDSRRSKSLGRELKFA